jgi:acyl-CoA synthetase (AMP-forming)/AMP-acid ligase II
MTNRVDPRVIERLAEQSITACLDEAAIRFRDNPALSDRDWIMSFDELNHLVDRLANEILQRTGRGRHPIILLMDQRAWAVVGFLAILKAGKICVPANPVAKENSPVITANDQSLAVLPVASPILEIQIFKIHKVLLSKRSNRTLSTWKHRQDVL